MSTTLNANETATRIEKDSMGEMSVPADVLYGASTQRAVLNFPISGNPVPETMIRAFAILKSATAKQTVNSANSPKKRPRPSSMLAM